MTQGTLSAPLSHLHPQLQPWKVGDGCTSWFKTNPAQARETSNMRVADGKDSAVPMPDFIGHDTFGLPLSRRMRDGLTL